MKKCIVCQKDIVSGKAAKVREDRIIRGLRKIKQMFNIARNFELYVCEEDFQKNTDKRKQYEKNVIVYTILAVCLFLVLVGLPLLGGKFNILLLLSCALLSILVVLFALLFKYVPATETQLEVISSIGSSVEVTKIIAPVQEKLKNIPIQKEESKKRIANLKR
ncbi:MAG: hypothetical protein Q7S22_02450 [Candidatus Micrarchaeota archaeon]|nr:hypothetical protein [Candidatus Micrarchaeota archaeon]